MLRKLKSGRVFFCTPSPVDTSPSRGRFKVYSAVLDFIVPLIMGCFPSREPERSGACEYINMKIVCEQTVDRLKSEKIKIISFNCCPK